MNINLKKFLDVIQETLKGEKRNDILLALYILRKHHLLDMYINEFFKQHDAKYLKERLCFYSHSGIMWLVMNTISWVSSSQGSRFWGQLYKYDSKINQDFEKCRIIRNKCLKKILLLQNEIVKGFDLRLNNSIRLTRLPLEKI